jgi:S1-C subfamily serine protease
MKQELYELLRQCTVRVSISGKAGYGTGFFVAPDLILTCAHVVRDAQQDTDSIEVKWNNQFYQVEIMKIVPDPDLVLLKIQLTSHPCVYLKGEVWLRDDLSSYGYTEAYPNGDSLTPVREGWTEDTYPLLKFRESQVQPGFSGAPLLNMRTGYVCGLVKRSRDRESELGGRAISTKTVFQVFPELQDIQYRFHQQDRRWLNYL